MLFFIIIFHRRKPYIIIQMVCIRFMVVFNFIFVNIFDFVLFLFLIAFNKLYVLLLTEELTVDCFELLIVKLLFLLCAFHIFSIWFQLFLLTFGQFYFFVFLIQTVIAFFSIFLLNLSRSVELVMILLLIYLFY